ncbi:hypothetical protein LMTR3_28455 [Bradyrhizobium sp. LMTR 3]|nr:hypothetical protein LMTR3_28455 [Bradyrhizobium sp. LMTR 3]
MASMTVASVHEQMHQRTGEQRQPDQQPQDVGLMFGEQQRAGDDQEPGQNKADAGLQRHSLAGGLLMGRMILH